MGGPFAVVIGSCSSGASSPSAPPCGRLDEALCAAGERLVGSKKPKRGALDNILRHECCTARRKDAEGSQHGPQLHDFMHSFPQTRRRSATDACLWLPRANRSLHGRFPSVRSRIPAKVCSSVPAALLLAGPVVGQKACVGTKRKHRRT